MPEKKTKKKTPGRKIASARKKAGQKAAPRKKAQGAAKKKRTVKKKTVAKKRAATPKKTTARKKIASRTAKKKTSAAKKRKVVPKKKQPVRKKTAVKKAAKKSTAVSRKPAKPKAKVQARMVKPRGDNSAPRRIRAYKLRKGEDYMNLQQLKHFSALLLGWKKELMKEVDKTVNHMQADATNFADPADRATQEEEFNLELRTRDRERKLIKKIDEAMGMIGADEYGYCNLCGAEIGIRRLEARPTATMCIDCKTLQELREKQIAD